MGRKLRTFASNSSATKNQEGLDEFLESTIMGPSHMDKQRMVFLYGSVTESLIGNVIGQLLHLAHSDTKPITLVISTYGGSTDEMSSIYDVIKFLPVEVQTVAIGKVQSAGCLILAAGAKGKRLISESTRVMLHPISVQGGGVEGNIFQIENQVKEMQAVQNKLVEALVKETGTDRAKIEQIMASGHDFYLDARAACELGLADKVIGG